MATRTARSALRLGLLAAMLIAAGCTTRVTRRVEPRLQGPSNAPAALVFNGPALANQAPPRWTLARNDASLSALPRAGTASGEHWPDPDRPSLLRARRVHFSDRPGTFLYFEPGPPDPGFGHDHWRPHGRRHDWWPGHGHDWQAWW